MKDFLHDVWTHHKLYVCLLCRRVGRCVYYCGVDVHLIKCTKTREAITK